MTGTGTETGRGRQTYKLWAEICSEIQEFQAATFGYSRAGHTLNCLHCSFSTPAYWSCSPSCHNCNGNCTCSCSQETSSKSCRGGHPLGGEAHEAEEEEGGQPGGAHTPGLLSGRPAYLGFFNVYAHVKTYVPCSAPHLSLPSHTRNMSPSLLLALLLICLMGLLTEGAPSWVSCCTEGLKSSTIKMLGNISFNMRVYIEITQKCRLSTRHICLLFVFLWIYFIFIDISYLVKLHVL